MTKPTISFAKAPKTEAGTLVLLTDADLALPDGLDGLAKAIKRAAKATSFEGKRSSKLELLAPADSAYDRVVVLGFGKAGEVKPDEWAILGGEIGAAGSEGDVTVDLSLPNGEAVTPEQASDIALGLTLRAYAFDKYKTKNKKKPKKRRFTLVLEEASAAQKLWRAAGAGLADGVELSRDLVNEPANALGPVEFAKKLEELEKLDVKVTVLDEKALRKQKMQALLGVSQGSVRPPRVVVMEWSGGKSKDAPLAFVGKGVVFDTGGISIKPASGMEDMKGDMGGAAAVSGLMHALASRKAKANVVGIVGLVENMPDGAAQRPGDIVTSMSGQTIEVINTDAEGRLVLADLMTYVQKEHEPKLIVDLATLTGAIIVALGNHYAGMFSNDDALADALAKAGTEVNDKVWRMPLGSEYDKMIDSKNADMKNIGGRWGGAITAAQFIHRFVENDTPWAHIDLAGTAMGSVTNAINQSWGSGYGVRLLDRFVRDAHEG